MLDKLTNLSNNPREFWQYVNKLENKTKSNECLFSDEEWVKHFTALNSKDPSLVSQDDPNVQIINCYEESTIDSLQLKLLELDRPFKNVDVVKVIDRLRNFKSSGYDNIVNEMLKAANM